jgi:hypothetical protein
MPDTSHTKAAVAHEAAGKIHRTAAEDHKKGDHLAGLEKAEQAVKLSQEAHGCCSDAHDKSKKAAH